MENDWLTDELMQRAAKVIQDIDGIASQGSVYVVSRALYEAEKRGREEAAKIVESLDPLIHVPPDDVHVRLPAGYAAAIRSGQ
jgi:hypothetical protein